MQETQDIPSLLWYHSAMDKNAFTTDELNQLPREMLVILYANLYESFRLLSEQNTVIQQQNEQLIRQVEKLREQVAILTEHRFCARSERNLQTEGQMSIDLGNMCMLNEAESLVENGMPEEPVIEEAACQRQAGRKPEGHRDSCRRA